jgi:hypothetical protein
LKKFAELITCRSLAEIRAVRARMIHSNECDLLRS